MLLMMFVVGAAGFYGFSEYQLPTLQQGRPMPSPQVGTPTAARMNFSMCDRGRGDTCVVDGDTIHIGGEVMRLRDIDAPETYRNLCGGSREVDLGKRAANRLRTLLNAGPVSVARTGQDRYDRTLVVIKAAGLDVGETLIKDRLARRWPDGEEWWCD